MKHTIKHTKILFEYINIELFDSELDQPYFNIDDYVKIDRSYGWCEWYRDNFFIALDKNLSYIEFFNTLVHELIHLWQAQNNKDMDHKKEFKNWCDKAYYIFH